jgi:hypothetical protein
MADTDIVNLLPAPYKYIFENLCLVYQHLNEEKKKVFNEKLLELVDKMHLGKIIDIDATPSKNGIINNLKKTAMNTISSKASANTNALKKIINQCYATSKNTTQTVNDKQINELANLLIMKTSQLNDYLHWTPFKSTTVRYLQLHYQLVKPSQSKEKILTKAIIDINNGYIEKTERIYSVFEYIVKSINDPGLKVTVNTKSGTIVLPSSNAPGSNSAPASHTTSDDNPSPEIIINSVKSLQEKANALQKEVDALKTKCDTSQPSNTDLTIELYTITDPNQTKILNDIFNAILQNNVSTLKKMITTAMFGPTISSVLRTSLHFLSSRVTSNNRKFTPFQYACHLGKKECIVFLLSLILMGGKDVFLKHVFLPVQFIKNVAPTSAPANNNTTQKSDGSDASDDDMSVTASEADASKIELTNLDTPEPETYANNAFELINKSGVPKKTITELDGILNDACSFFSVSRNGTFVIHTKLLGLPEPTTKGGFKPTKVSNSRTTKIIHQGGRTTRKYRPAL